MPVKGLCCTTRAVPGYTLTLARFPGAARMLAQLPREGLDALSFGMAVTRFVQQAGGFLLCVETLLVTHAACARA